MSLAFRPAGLFTAVALLLAAISPGLAKEYKYTLEERIALTRDLTAEFATAKVILPRSKKPLPLEADSGQRDLAAWTDAHQKFGPAAQLGDLIQVTKIKIQHKQIIFEINGGFKGGRKWYERIQVGGGMGGGGTMTPISRSGNPNAMAVGTNLALVFPDGVPELDAEQIREMLYPIMDFEIRSATEQYVESLPEPVQEAIKEKRAIEGMDHDSVLLSMGKPVRKVRETKDGVEYEDWIYGEPPGKVVFVTFRGKEVVRVREAYGGLGGSVAPRQQPN